jgi:hypothetical protein
MFLTVHPNKNFDRSFYLSVKIPIKPTSSTRFPVLTHTCFFYCTVGIQAAISKSKKNIAPKLYVRIKEIKRKINALELYRDPSHSDSVMEEISREENITGKEITVEGQSDALPDQNLSIKSKNLQLISGSLENLAETSDEIDADSNDLQQKINLISDVKKSKENKKKLSRTILKLKEKNNREENMLKKADALLDGINVRIGVEGKPIEQTWERVILAEKMRIELSRNCISKIANDGALEGGEISLSCGELYVEYINRNYNLHQKNIL